MQMEISVAETELEALLDAALRGEEALILRDGRPVAMLDPIVEAAGSAEGEPCPPSSDP